jgi:hypothetical protein
MHDTIAILRQHGAPHPPHPVAIRHEDVASAQPSMIPKSMSSTLIGDGYRFSEKDHAQTKS